MDPASGRRFVTTERFLDHVYDHQMVLPVDQVRDWLCGDGFLDPSRESACRAYYDPAELDCDDNNAAISPTAYEEAGNGIDDDCDGLIDEP